MTGRQKVMLAAWATISSASFVAQGQVISYSTVGGNYTQDFNSLATATGTAVGTFTWDDGLTINGWYAAQGVTSAPSITYRANNGSANSGAIYSYGSGDSTDRALGSLGSGSTGPTGGPTGLFYGMKLQNNTSSTLDRLTLSFTGEEWRATGNALASTVQNKLTFAYSTSASTIYDPTGYTTNSALDFVAPQGGQSYTQPDGAVDGNTAPFQAAVSATIPIIGGWAPGQSLWVRWLDVNDAGNDQGLAIDNLTFSASITPVASNNSTLSVGGSKTASAGGTSNRVVAGNNSASLTISLSNSGTDTTTYSDFSSSGAAVVPATGSVPAAGSTNVGVRINASELGNAQIGQDVTKTAVIKNTGNTSDPDVQVQVTAHVVTNRFVDNFDMGSGLGGSAAPVDFGKMLVGATKTVSGVALSTVNTDPPGGSVGDLSSNYLTTVELPANAVTGFAGGATSGFATVTMQAGNTVTFDDGSDTEMRDVTLTPIQSGEVVSGTTPAGSRGTGFLSIPVNQVDTAVGANVDARVYVKGDFYAAAAPVASPTPVAPGGTVTLTNSAPTGDGTAGKRLGADILGQTTNQSGWSITGLPASIGGARAAYSTFTAVVSTATGQIAFSTAGKLNATYGATISLNMQNDQTQGVYGVAPGDLPGVTQVAVEGTVSDKPANHPGAYSLNGGTMNAGATNLTGSFTQSGGSATIASLVGGGGLTVSGGSLTLGTGAATPADVVGSLSVTGTGKLVLLDRHLAVTGGMSASTLRGAIAAGYNGGSWAGATSGIALDASDVNGVIGIGYGTGAKLLGLTGAATTNWFGATVNATSALISKTYYGDANLDGKVNADDLVLTDLGFAKNLAAGTAVWTDGDYDYNGVVNALDYVQIDRSLLLQGSPLAASAIAAHAELFGEGYAASVLASVPEPASLGLIGAGLVGLAGRRRRVAK